jgi:BNR repeat-like domain
MVRYLIDFYGFIMNRRIRLSAALLSLAVIVAAALWWWHRSCVQPPTVPALAAIVDKVSPFQALGSGKWTRSLRLYDGTILLHGNLQTRDAGLSVESQTAIDVEAITAHPERATLSMPDLFYALDGTTEPEGNGQFTVTAWRSIDELKTLVSETVHLHIPQGAVRTRRPGEWFGLYVYRTILVMPDGSWRLTMYGNFEQDKLHPADRSSQHETTYQMRSIILRSDNQGRSWEYLATIAAPRQGDPVGEGFVEPALTMLKDGRLLAVMRTGHYFPLYASWSDDGGATWTPPVYTGLDRACDPALITLADGRIALSWGRRFSQGWSRIDTTDDFERFQWPGETILNLAISSDNGMSWINQPIATRSGSGYSTIFEVAPNLLFVQTDHWMSRVSLNSSKP